MNEIHLSWFSVKRKTRICPIVSHKIVVKMHLISIDICLPNTTLTPEFTGVILLPHILNQIFGGTFAVAH